MGSETPDLIFACAFGPRADQLLGERISSTRGIVGQVYQRGQPVLTNDTAATPTFDNEYDKKLSYQSKSVLCVPIFVGDSICGVIELVNKLQEKPYTDSDRNLLQIFAGYIASSFQNILDASHIEKMVRLDNLTGLFNDRHLHECLREEVATHSAKGLPLSLLFLDLDHFKKVNDTHGHLAGSAVLAEYGGVLRDAVDFPNHTAARYGGDEFVLVLPGCDNATALALAEKIRSVTKRHIFLNSTWGNGRMALNLAHVLTVSIGVGTYVPKGILHERDAESVGLDLLSASDKAMFMAKDNGRNKVFQAVA